MKCDGKVLNHAFITNKWYWNKQFISNSPSTDEFTKSELAEIMDGALYKKADYCEFMELPPDWEMNDENDKWLCEWINPLIELVSVEDGE